MGKAPLGVRWLQVLTVGLLAAGCYPAARWYAPREPRPVRDAKLEYQATSVHVIVGDQLGIKTRLRVSSSDYALGPPRLTRPDLPACESGELPSMWSYIEAKSMPSSDLNGMLDATFLKNQKARELLSSGPTVLDVPLLSGKGERPSCVRISVLERPARPSSQPEWEQAPLAWVGGSIRGVILSHHTQGLNGIVLGGLGFGGFAGPLRLGAELTGGGGVEPRHPAPGERGSYSLLGVGLTLDSPTLAFGQLGFGSKLAFDSMWLDFLREGHAERERPVSRGALYGPRAAIHISLLPPPPISSAYRARPDAWSTGLELGITTLFHDGTGSPTPAWTISYYGDIGF